MVSKEREGGLPYSVKAFLEDIREGLSFGFRFPNIPGGGTATSRMFASSLWNAPLVGLLLGALSLLPGWFLWEMTLSAWLSVLGILLVLMVLPGSLYEDGMADIADGFGVVGAGTDVDEKRLAVMKDPRLGTFGVHGLIMVFAFRLFGMLTVFFGVGFGGVAMGVLTIVPLSRVGMVWLLRLLPVVRKGGFADRAGVPSVGVVVCATILGFSPALFLWGWWIWVWVFSMLLVCVCWFLLMKRVFGGVTGDGCGALVVLAESVLWLVLSGLTRFGVAAEVNFETLWEWW